MKRKKIKFDFTIKQLKEIIKDLPDDLPVGSIGHYGEFYPMSTYNFGKRKAMVEKTEVRLNIFEIIPKDLGPEPD